MVNNKILLFLLILISSWKVQGSEIDYLSLAEVLLRDKNYSRAKSALMKAKKNWGDIEEEHYHLLNGLYLLRTKKAEDSIPELLKVKEQDYLDKKQIYLAEAYLEINQKTDALRQINKIKMGERTSLAVKHLKAKILFENQKYQKALDLLYGLLHLKKEVTLRLTLYYMTSLGLFEEAMTIYRSFRDEKKLEKQSLLVARLFQQWGQRKKALMVLEEATLHFPYNTELLNFMTFLYDREKKIYAAGDLYTKLAYIDNSFAYGAGEYLKRSGRVHQAHIINMNVGDQKKQLLQKLSIYIKNEKYNLARSLKTPLKQLKAFEDDEIKYAFAYTYLTQGEYNQSIQLLKKIKKNGLINKSVKLLAVVRGCQKNRWECYGYF